MPGLVTNLITGYMKKRSAKKSKAANDLPYDPANPDTYKRGGKVKRTGMAKVHRGERVLTRAQARKYKRGGSKR